MGRSSVGMVESAAAVIAYNLRDSSSWWHDINASPLWQDRIFHGLAILYALVAVVALVIIITSLSFSLSLCSNLFTGIRFVLFESRVISFNGGRKFGHY